MITAILIDDERPALRELKFFLDAYPDISVLGLYKNPLEAISAVGDQKPDVVFLDINMPKLTGTDAASRILDVSPATEIVFVTAYDQYAVQAFEQNALDYILKPIEGGRFAKTMQRIVEKKKEAAFDKDMQGGKDLQIRCFGKLRVGWEDREPIKWRTEKTRALFSYMLCNRKENFYKEEIIDRLWPEEDSDKAMKQLYNGVYYIRKTLQNYGISPTLLGIDSDYHMHVGQVNWDFERFCTLHKSLDSLGLPRLIEMEELYTGELLEGELAAWIELKRKEAAKCYEQCIKRILCFYEEEAEKKEDLLLRAFSKAPLNENLTVLLLDLYKQTGNRFDALSHYDAYARLLKRELNTDPGQKLKKLIDL